jgi:nitrogenase subunit NifH
MKQYNHTHCDKTAVPDPGAGCEGSVVSYTLCTMETEAAGFTRTLAQSQILQEVQCENMVIQMKKLEGIRYSLFH